MTSEPSTYALRTRRRSLKALLRLPLFPRASAFTHPISSRSAPGPLGTVPPDIILEIVENLGSYDILSFSLTSSQLRELLLPELYRTVYLRSSRTCASGLRMLTRRPDLCAYIQKLAVRPNYYLAWPKVDQPLSEDWVASMISKIAQNLTRLHTFDWDGLEMPADSLWLTLRNACPELKQVFSNLGHQPLDPYSQLFQFDDLTNFSLSVRHGLGETDAFPTPEELPTQLWDMLFQRCPNLEELTLCSFSASHRLIDINKVTQGTWPKLHSLTLGSFGFNIDLTLSSPPAELFGTFLSSHLELSYIRLSWNFKRWISPDEMPTYLKPTALPGLDSFVGVFQQVTELPAPACASLTTLDLMCEPLYASRTDALLSTLRALPALAHLDIWAHVPDPGAGHTGFFRGLLGACPGLEDLHFMCTTSFGKKPLSELAAHLHLLPHLRSFTLTKGHRYADESMLRSALRVLRAPGVSPRLAQVSVRWARAKCRNHLKQEGQYDVVTVGVGGERTVEAWERGLRAVGAAFERRYRYTLVGGDGDAGSGGGGFALMRR
ncbi:hypothetical protein B0H10DRAFT_1813767 [Mycena sp. CBHHK59/15]|nr:hypothetical protein B0H10DRAFT_1813767 [Mycena sp. CBHHK59/15]